MLYLLFVFKCLESESIEPMLEESKMISDLDPEVVDDTIYMSVIIDDNIEISENTESESSLHVSLMVSKTDIDKLSFQLFPIPWKSNANIAWKCHSSSAVIHLCENILFHSFVKMVELGDLIYKTDL